MQRSLSKLPARAVIILCTTHYTVQRRQQEAVIGGRCIRGPLAVKRSALPHFLCKIGFRLEIAENTLSLSYFGFTRACGVLRGTWQTVPQSPL